MYKKEAKKYNIEYISAIDATFYNKMCDTSYKTILVALFPYFAGENKNSNLSKYCQSLDYHKVCTSIMDKILKGCNFKDYKIFCDTGLLIDRMVAHDASLGFFGKNSMLINEKYGSYFFIAYALLNEDLEKTKNTDTKTCIGCNKCIQSCPGGAIESSGKVNIDKCLSHITQKKGELTDKEQSLIKKGGLIFGCDVCQDVCPHNKNVQKTKIDAFLKNRIEKLSLCDIEGLSNKEFKEKYGDYAFSWRGKKVLERNLKLL